MVAAARARILVVDDDFSVRDSMQKWLAMDGYEVIAAKDAVSALACVQREAVDLALVDIRMPGMDGVELQRRLSELEPHLPVVMITAYGSIKTAVEVLKRGAVDYLTKPVDPDELSRAVRRILQQHEWQGQTQQHGDFTLETDLGELLVGNSPPMRQLRAQVEAAARSEQPVLIVGEPGSGRHTVAAAIHQFSSRRFFDLVPLDCTSLTEDNIDAGVAGRRTSASGAGGDRKCLLELADSGTLVLEMLDRLPLALQAALLQRLETATFYPLDGGQPRPANIRLIGIAGRALRPLVDAGAFSERLFYRVAVLEIDTPALRQYASDIPLVAQALLRRVGEQDSALRALQGFTPDALDQLAARQWLGNVAELANTIRRAAAAATPPHISAADLGQPTKAR